MHMYIYTYYVCNSCNTGMSGLPIMYTQSPRAEGGHIRQTISPCMCYNYYVTLPSEPTQLFKLRASNNCSGYSVTCEVRL